MDEKDTNVRKNATAGRFVTTVTLLPVNIYIAHGALVSNSI